MKKLLLGLAIATLSLSGTSASVGATDSCTISNTGPDSTNSCVVKEDFTCKVENDNKFTVINKNNQEATSGSAAVSGNTTGGSATSGSATNSNGTVIDVTITNSGCVVAAVTPPAPVTPVGGSGGGSGGGQPVSGMGAAQPRPVGGMGAVAAPQKAAPTMLPDTSATSTIGITAGLVALLAAAIVGSRFAVGAYSNIKS
ncbi:MAG: hypothetical protein JWM07_39 [Candidatus Saccharibacteria bacterium]|nr:hypothetical protein [Candidatus Saccharibacteria bacterium]